MSALTIPTSFTEKWWPRESRHAPVLPVSQCEKNLEPSTQLRRLSSFRYFDEITGEFMLSSRAPHFSVSGPYTGIWSGSLGRAAKAGTRLPSQHHTPPSGAERKQNACRWGLPGLPGQHGEQSPQRPSTGVWREGCLRTARCPSRAALACRSCPVSVSWGRREEASSPSCHPHCLLLLSVLL